MCQLEDFKLGFIQAPLNVWTADGINNDFLRILILKAMTGQLALPTELSGQVLIEGSLTPLLFVHQLTFGLRGTEKIQLKSIEHDYIRIIEDSVFQAMGISTVGKA